MRSISLKINIFCSLALLLSVAAILGNLVTVIVWQRGIVQNEVRHIQSMLLLAGYGITNRQHQKITEEDLDTICIDIGRACVDIVYSDGSKIIGTSGYKRIVLLETAVQESIETREKIVRLEDFLLGTGSFGEKQFVASVPVYLADGRSAGLGAAIKLVAARQIFLENIDVVLVYMLMNVVILTVIGLFRFIGSIVRPIERLLRTTESYDARDGIIFLGEQSGNEIGQLSFALNRMVARIADDRQRLQESLQTLESVNSQLVHNQKEMVRAEKLAALGRLSAGIAHEIGNPLGIVQGYVELLMHDDLSQEDRRQFTQRALAELQRVDRLVRQLLNLARTANRVREVVSVHVLLDEIVDIFSRQKSGPRITMKNECGEGVDTVLVNVEELRQVFLNCMLNSLDAIAEKGENFEGSIVIDCKCNTEERKVVRIAFEDNGTGIETENFEAIFDPFMTTKPPGKGTGLGLSISNSIIQSAGGRMWAESREDSGARLVIELPLADRYEAREENVHGQN